MANYDPDSDLERSLIRACTNPAFRPQFYKDIIQSKIYAITAGNSTTSSRDGKMTLPADTQLNLLTIERNGKRYIPIFTSLSRLQQSIRKEATYLQIGAKDLFEITRGIGIILNPGLGYEKEFLPEEITRILDGSIFNSGERIEIKKATQVLIGQPLDYPQELVKALSELFATRHHVKAAYLVQIQYPETETNSHPLVLIDADKDYETIVGEAGIIVSNIVKEKFPVDFIRMNNTKFCVEIINSTKPFYKRSFLAGLLH